MATVPDKSGNSPIGYAIEQHLEPPTKNVTLVDSDGASVTGLATEAKQDDMITVLNDIETNTSV